MTRDADTQDNFFTCAERVLNEKAALTRCNGCQKQVVRIKNTFNVRCKNKSCRKMSSVARNDEIKTSKLKYETLIKLIYSITNNMRSRNIKQMLGVSTNTITKYRRILQNSLKNEHKENRIVIGGDNVTVEVDESLFGKRKYNRGRAVKGVWVLGLVERTPARRIILSILKKRDKKTLRKKIRKYVSPNSNIFTDKWGGYVDLNRYFNAHQTVNHSVNFVDPITLTHTQTIESNWSVIKQNIPKKHRNKADVRFYLLLFMFRRNWGSSFYEKLINLL